MTATLTRPRRIEAAPQVRPASGPAGVGMPSGGRARLALLDVLRLVAAVSVVLFHWTAWHHGNWGRHGTPAAEAWPELSQWSSVGALGVQLFFIISGFVILLSCHGRSPARFIGSRIGRLYPAYWVAVLAVAVLLFVLWPELGVNRSPSEILPNLTSIILVSITTAVPAYIGAEAGLSYLGVGLAPPTADWGLDISLAQTTMQQFALPLLVPLVALLIVVLCLSLLGDAISDAFNPNTRR